MLTRNTVGTLRNLTLHWKKDRLLHSVSITFFNSDEGENIEHMLVFASENGKLLTAIITLRELMVGRRWLRGLLIITRCLRYARSATDLSSNPWFGTFSS